MFTKKATILSWSSGAFNWKLLTVQHTSVYHTFWSVYLFRCQYLHSLVPVNYKGAEKSHGNNISRLSTVCLADDKTLQSVLTLRIDWGSSYLLYKVIRPVWVFTGIFLHSFLPFSSQPLTSLQQPAIVQSLCLSQIFQMLLSFCSCCIFSHSFLYILSPNTLF